MIKRNCCRYIFVICFTTLTCCCIWHESICNEWSSQKFNGQFLFLHHYIMLNMGRPWTCHQLLWYTVMDNGIIQYSITDYDIPLLTVVSFILWSIYHWLWYTIIDYGILQYSITDYDIPLLTMVSFSILLLTMICHYLQW